MKCMPGAILSVVVGQNMRKHKNILMEFCIVRHNTVGNAGALRHWKGSLKKMGRVH